MDSTVVGETRTSACNKYFQRNEKLYGVVPVTPAFVGGLRTGVEPPEACASNRKGGRKVGKKRREEGRKGRKMNANGSKD